MHEHLAPITAPKTPLSSTLHRVKQMLFQTTECNRPGFGDVGSSSCNGCFMGITSPATQLRKGRPVCLVCVSPQVQLMGACVVCRFVTLADVRSAVGDASMPNEYDGTTAFPSMHDFVVERLNQFPIPPWDAHVVVPSVADAPAETEIPCASSLWHEGGSVWTVTNIGRAPVGEASSKAMVHCAGDMSTLNTDPQKLTRLSARPVELGNTRGRSSCSVHLPTMRNPPYPANTDCMKPPAPVIKLSAPLAPTTSCQSW
eukprot:m.522678 g.522678  ORF g.522678 m.522678 type:complete len:257 (-) comp21968_c0_seq3:2290-3060(-)